MMKQCVKDKGVVWTRRKAQCELHIAKVTLIDFAEVNSPLNKTPVCVSILLFLTRS